MGLAPTHYLKKNLDQIGNKKCDLDIPNLVYVKVRGENEVECTKLKQMERIRGPLTYIS